MTNGRAPGSGVNENRNFIMFVIIAAMIMIGWEFLYARPMEQKAAAARAQVEAQHQQEVAQAPAAPVVTLVPRDQALSQSAAQRVRIATDAVDGSILLTGARFDDLELHGYHQTVDQRSPYVTLLQPSNSEHGYDAYFGWQENKNTPDANIVSDQSVWTAAAGQTLTPTTPVVLTYTAPDGLQFTRTYSIDQNYMITSRDEVRNPGAAAVTIRPFGHVRRQGLPTEVTNGNVIQGYAAVFDNHLTTHTYQEGTKLAADVDQGKQPSNTKLFEAQGHGWLGISDHYWLTALIPDQHEAVSANFGAANHPGTPTNFSAGYTGQWHTIAPGQSITYTQRLFSGAKRVDLLQDYQHDRAHGATHDGPNTIADFDKAVDWGNIMWPLTRPFFWVLDHLAQVGHALSPTYAFAIGLLFTTVVVRLIFFPIMYNSQKSMGKLRILAPKMKEIQERYAADPQKQQQEMMKLYQTEKINPVTGCLPMFLQIPVFFALYKTLSVTIEMRHAPFWGWVHDLSAPDPAMLLNLFGLLPWDPHAVPIIGNFLGIGIWPILYGISMMGQQALSPPPPDPTQAQIFRLMPIIFTLMLAGLPAGLLIYYTWSYSLLILQQYVILRRQGVETPFDQFMKKRFGGAATEKVDSV